MRLAVTGATGFLGWRATVVLRERGHDVLAVARPGGTPRAHAHDLEVTRIDAGDPAVRALVAGRDAVLHFAGVPDPAGARRDPASVPAPRWRFASPFTYEHDLAGYLR